MTFYGLSVLAEKYIRSCLTQLFPLFYRTLSSAFPSAYIQIEVPILVSSDHVTPHTIFLELALFRGKRTLGF